MKKSLILLLTIFITLILLDRVLALTIMRFEKQVYSGQSVGKVNHFLLVKDSVDILIFGDSRANHHVKNAIFDDSSFNAGMDGTDLSLVSALASTLNRNGQIILVHIDPVTILNPKIEERNYSALKHQFHRNANIRAFIKKHDPVLSNILYMFHTYSYNGVLVAIIKNLLKPGIEFNEESGFVPLVPTKRQVEIFNSDIKEYAPESYYYDGALKANSESDMFIDEINAVAEKNHSKLVFFTSPSLKALDLHTRDWIKSYFNSKNLQYFDYATLIGTDEPDSWRDFTHLSLKGAEFFTNYIIESGILIVGADISDSN